MEVEKETVKRSRSASKSEAQKKKIAKKIKSEAVEEEDEQEDEDIEDLIASPSKAKLSHLETLHYFSNDEKRELSRQLLSWYEANCRSLPWRAPPCADHSKEDRGYAVWVSEIMLQQTRVATVIDYYTRWMKKWPTIESLANAPGEEVNEMWKGLGYYRRARFLHEGAKEVLSIYQGKLPRTAEKLSKLPGIGKYTAGAIASIAYGQPTPVVDGNVIRVISRLRAVDSDPKKKDTVELMWRLATELVQAAHAQRENCAGDLNQALMELGATVCTPLAPQCGKCPVSSLCKAYQMAKPKDIKFEPKTAVVAPDNAAANSQEPSKTSKVCTVCEEDPRTRVESVTVFPRKAKKAAQREETIAIALLEVKGPTYLIMQRPATGLLASLWEFPAVKIDDEDRCNEAIDEHLSSIGIASSHLKGATRKHLGETTHLFTHIRQKAIVQSIVLSELTHQQLMKEMGQVEKRTNTSPLKWVSRDELETAAVSTGMKKAFELLSKAPKSPLSSVSSPPKSAGSQKSIMSFFKKV